jgi:hypothetical protein
MEFKLMYSLSAMILEMQTARKRLLKLFDVPNGTSTCGLQTHRILNGRESIGFLTRLKGALALLRDYENSAQAMKIGQPPQQTQRRHPN